MSWLLHLEIIWKHCEATVKASIPSGSTKSGGSALCGGKVTPTTWKMIGSAAVLLLAGGLLVQNAPTK